MATINLIRLAVGITDMNHLAAVQRSRLLSFNGESATETRTRHRPRREAELLNGGSLYWVIRNNIMLRQRVIALEGIQTETGPVCRLILDPQLIRLAAVQKKAFQGWRYLKIADAPRDLGVFHPGVEEGGDIPAEMAETLKILGLS
ncbi:MAG: DUF1489 family protein [Micavibrio sp.]